MSKVNMNDGVTINELRTLIPLVGSELTVVVQSEPGCGKSSLLHMIAEDMGDSWRKVGDDFADDKYDYIYVDCPVKDMSDIGMTIPNHATQTLEYYVSSLFKMGNGKPKVIMLDEFMKSPKLLQVLFTRLMLERTVGDEPLPEGSIVIGTSNNESDGVGDTMLSHAGNRVMRVRMTKPTVPEWLQWASTAGIARPIRAFVAMYPRVLKSYLDEGQDDNPYIFNPKKAVLSFASPRSLAKCDVVVKNSDKMTENTLTCALAGTIGASAAKDLATFISLEKSVVDVKDIIKDPKGIKMPEDIAAQLMIMFQALDVLDSQDDFSAFMEFVNRIESEEVQSIFFTMSLNDKRLSRIASRNQQMKDWARDNSILLA